MKLRVYQGELFERGILRRVVSTTLVLGLVFLTIFGQEFAHGGSGKIWSFSTFANTIVILLLVGGYYRYLKTIVETPVDMYLTEQGVVVGNKVYLLGRLEGFVVELDLETETVKNIVLVERAYKHHIFTFAEELEKIEAYIDDLETYLPRLNQYEQTWIQRAARKLKVSL